MGDFTLTSDVEIPVQAALSASVGDFTLASSVTIADAGLNASLTAGVGDFTLVSDVDVVVGTSLSTSFGDFTLTSDIHIVAPPITTNLNVTLDNFTLSAITESFAPPPVVVPSAYRYITRLMPNGREIRYSEHIRRRTRRRA